MSHNTFGKLFRVTTFGESHGPAIGCVIDGCPPGLEITAEEIRSELERRATGRSRHTSQRREKDEVQILSGMFEGRTTGTPVALVIENTDARSRDYDEISRQFRPGHADYTYWKKYGVRDYRGGGRSSARETTMRVAAGALALAAHAQIEVSATGPTVTISYSRLPRPLSEPVTSWISSLRFSKLWAETVVNLGVPGSAAS